MSGLGSFLKDFSTNIPGIDEAMSFAELMRHVQRMEFDVTVFDTAPTGHTLRLLSLPGMLDKALTKLLSLRERFGPLLSSVTGMMGGAGQGLPSEDQLLGKLDELKGAWWCCREAAKSLRNPRRPHSTRPFSRSLVLPTVPRRTLSQA
jgi:arsenite-transporting ATPase